MVFALDKENGKLLVLATADEAPHHCKGVDVEDGYWLFFAEDGSPLEARFRRIGGEVLGPFVLQRAMTGLWLQERLEQVTTVEGCGFTTVGGLVETWRPGKR